MKTQVTKRFLSCLLALAMLLSLLPAAAAAEGDAIICDLQVEYMENPMGIEVATPRFSWRMESNTRGQKQTAYEILVASSEALLAENEADIWDSGKVESAQSVGVKYGGEQKARTRYFWKVLVWDKDGIRTESDTAWWETGLMDEGWSGAKWIGEPVEGATSDAAELTTFTIDVDFEVEDTAFGLIFGAKNTSNFYMWQISGSAFRNADYATFRPHQWKNGSGSCIETKAIPTTVYPTRTDAIGNPSHLKIQVVEGVVTTWIDDIQIDRRDMGVFTLGKLGFRTAHNDRADVNEHEKYYADNLTVTDGEGDVVFFEDFSGENTTFPAADGIVNGRLYVTHDKLFLQADAVEADETTFTIDVDYKVEDTAFGIIFGAADLNNYYLWQVNGSAFRHATMATFRPHQWKGGSGSCIETVVLDASIYENREALIGNESHMTIQVKKGTVTTFIDGIQVDQRAVAPFSLGKLGFRAASNGRADVNEHEKYYVDNLVVKNSLGEVVFSEDFSGANTHFPDANGIVDGWLYVTHDKTFLQADPAKAAAMVRKSFTVEEKTVARARLYATAAGIYDFYINGAPVTDTYFNPGRTTYTTRVMYQTYDVTELIQSGKNAMGAVIGKGWYNLDRIYTGEYQALYAKLVVDYTDGTSQTVVTDTSWKYADQGPLLEDDFWMGETYDAGREIPGWNTADFNDSRWVRAGSQNKSVTGIGKVVAQEGPLVKETMTLTPVAVTEPKDNVFIYDFGQNFAGTVRICLTGEAGQTIRMRYAEMLNDAPKGTRGCDDSAGTIYQANLRSAKNTDFYTLKGDPAGETADMRFVYHGFRYLEITGLEEPLPLDAIDGVVLCSVDEETSTFESSNELVNQLYSNVVWGQRGNFLSVPTDCPQRDERRGFTGDAQIFARTACYNMDSAAFLEKYMQDICDNQTASGAFPHMAPSLDGYNPVAGGWMDAGIVIPWTLYQQYGNVGVLEEYYDNMSRYIDHLVSTSSGYIRNRTQYGDWLSIGESTPNDVLDTAFCVYSSDLMTKIAGVLGKDEDAARFAEIAANFRAAWQETFVQADGTLKNPSQTGYALGLYFNIFKEADRAAAAAALAKNIEDRGGHLTTGFCGVAYLAPALSESGYMDVAYTLLEQESYPSWLYPVLQGATTVWERWNSYTLESGFGSAGMNSFNHYSYGSVFEWIYRYALGMEWGEDDTGLQHMTLRPTPGGTFTYMKGSYDSVYGTIVSEWEVGENATTYHVVVPANTTATLYLEVPEDAVVLESGKAVAMGENGLELESGDYTFVVSENKFDVNQDGVVNLLDMTRAQKYFGTDEPIADVNKSGKVDIEDLILILNHFL